MNTRLRFHGRREILTYEKEITKDNICEVLKRCVSIHMQNRKEIEYLHNYIKGNQPINYRVKEIRPEINNKILENHALEINNFKVGFVFGEPVQYVVRGSCELDSTDNTFDTEKGGVAALNELMELDGKAGKDRILAEWLNECGLGYRIVLPTAAFCDMPFEMHVLDPRNTFVVKSGDYRRDVVMGVTYCRSKDKEGEYYIYSIYTPGSFFIVNYRNGNYSLGDAKKNELGLIPIIEYINNPHMTGSYETVLSLCDGLNAITSNCIDGIEQLIQSFVWFNNCDIDKDGLQNLRAMGAIKTKSDPAVPANIQAIKTELDQQQVQTLKEEMYQTMLNIACVPDRRASAGGNTGQALIIGEGWIMAESAAKSFEQTFIVSEKMFLRVVLKICQEKRATAQKMKDLMLHEIEVKFTRNKTDNLLVKTQGLMNMLQAGIHPRIAISNCGLFSDPEQVYRDSRESLNRMLFSEASANDGNITDDQSGNISDEISEALKLISEMDTNGNS